MNRKHEKFTDPLLKWFDQHGRKDLPWQTPRNAYRVWVSEIMLQQTQVKTVIPYFTRFMLQFPDIDALATASLDEVLAHWAGLGYYSRARHLHQTAQIVATQFLGQFPQDLATLKALPGIGPSTAAAIASLAFNQPTAILDGNVKRVLSRYFQVEGLPLKRSTEQKLWQFAHECMPQQHCAEYSQAIMDLGATCCTPKQPTCARCPLSDTCQAFLNDVVQQYPHKKPKVVLPSQHQQFLVLHTHASLLYLEKRPPTGIWGGLWCLPTLEIQQCATLYVDQHYKLHTKNQHELMSIKHTFSHFHLYIKAIALESTSQANLISESSGRWFNQEEIQGLGLPKPVKTIIQYFFSEKI